MKTVNKILRSNRYLSIVPLISFLFLTISPFLEAAEFGRSVDFLIQSGISLYDQGRFIEAMQEFKRALIINPNSMVAKEFLSQIQKEISGQEEEKGVSRYLAIEETLDKFESRIDSLKSMSLEKEDGLIAQREIQLPVEKLSLPPEKKPIPVEPPKTILLDEKLKANQGNVALGLEKDSSAIIQGDNIKRFLNNSPEKIEIKRQDDNNVIVTAKSIGKGIFHIWDNSGRWTFDFTGKQKRFISALQEEYEKMEKPVGLSEPFKITYNFSSSSFHTGRRIDTTQRQSLQINQGVSVRGETPYGNYDASFAIERLNKEYEVDNLTMGLTDAHLLSLEHLNLRFFDFNQTFSAYKIPKASLRGVSLNTTMFDDRLSYNAFWGGIPEGNYTRLSPGLGRTKEAYLEGLGLQYRYSKNAKYKFYYAHSYGLELTQPVLTNNAFGLGAFYKISNLNFDSEVANDDAGHISYTTSARLSLSKTRLSLSFTDDDRDFVSPLGGAGGGGATTTTLGVNFYPTEDFSMANNLSVTRDKDLYNINDPKRPNYNFDSEANWRLDPHTTVNFGYSRNDNKGSVSPSLSQNKKLGIRKTFFFLKELQTNLSYLNSTNKSFTGSTANYDKDTFGAGLGFNVLRDIHFSINKRIGFIENRVTKESAHSHTLETSLSHYSRILKSPFYGRFRVSFRDEEETESSLSYLSGQDRLEFSADLDYRPNPYISGYLGGRVANVWAEKEGNTKHLDAEVKYGLRLVWDTGLRWNTRGNVSGYVFNDLNGDGIRDRGEEGMAGILINATTKKSDTTDEKGYYKIKNIVGKKARVALELSTIPRSYTLTTPSFYDIEIKHASTQRLDFGLTTRSEIIGVVFVDTNGNNQFDRDEETISGVVFILDDTQRVATDQGGQCLFRRLSPGEHTIVIDLKTLPTKYIPKVALKKKVILEEGATFFYNVPLRKSSQNK